MSIVTLSDAQEHLADLVERAQAGEIIQISSEGEVVAQIAPARPQKKPIDMEAIQKLTNSMQYHDIDGGEWIRAMRDNERY